MNAEILARERGIMINESRSRDETEHEGFSSSVTLRARLAPRSSSRNPTSQRTGATERAVDEHVISGFVSGTTPYISRLGRFRTSFVPSGTLLICRNYDSPGKIGIVGGRLGKAGVNIRFMSVAPIDASEQGDANGSGLAKVDSLVERVEGVEDKEHEALMILGVEGTVSEDVRRDLVGGEGVLEAGVVVL